MYKGKQMIIQVDIPNDLWEKTLQTLTKHGDKPELKTVTAKAITDKTVKVIRVHYTMNLEE